VVSYYFEFTSRCGKTQEGAPGKLLQISGHDPKMSAWYVNAPITLAKGVFIVPEVGMYDFHDSAVTANLDLKDFTYFGARWQINF